MTEYTSAFFDMPWLDIATGLAAVIVGWSASKALTTWKQELRTRKRLEFLDDFNEVFYEYCNGMRMAWDFDLAIRKRLIDIHEEKKLVTTDPHADIDWADDFLDNSAVVLAGYVQDYLKKIEPAKIKLDALVSKGHVLHMKRYADFESASKAILACWSESDTFTHNIIKRKNGMFKYLQLFLINSKVNTIVINKNDDLKRMDDTFNTLMNSIRGYVGLEYGRLINK